MALPYNVRQLDGVGPSIAAPEGNFAAELVKWANSVMGQGSVAIGAASATVDVDPALHGRPLVATNNGVVATGAADATATTLLSARWHATILGRFTVTYDANATALTGFSYLIGAAR